MELTEKPIRCLIAAARAGKFKSRSWLLDALTYTQTCSKAIDYPKQARVGFTLELEDTEYPNLGVGDVVAISNAYRGIVADHTDTGLLYLDVLSPMDKPCFDLLDVFEPDRRDLVAAFGKNKLTDSEIGLTSVGRWITNILCMQYPFNYQLFEYVNKKISPDDFLKLVKDALLNHKITNVEFDRFVNNAYFIGHMNELNTPSLSERSIQTDPRVEEVKRKFIEEHKDQMGDPMVIEQLESILIKMDKEWLKDDHSKVFIDSLGSKGWKVQRKKQFLSIGGIPAFDNAAGTMDFIPNSLSEGITIKSLPSIANEIRKGSYERGVETAKGGTETKFIMRAFQDAAIVADDCGTHRTITVDCRSGFPGPKDFIGRCIQHNGKDVFVTDENCKELIEGKIIKLYSPMTCAIPGNFCYKCCGQKTKDLHVKLLGIQAIKITSGFMMISMKNMHGTALEIRKNKLEDILL